MTSRPELLAVIALAAPSVLACSQTGGAATCLSDSDCPGHDVCNHGRCFAPVARGSNSNGGSSGGGATGSSSSGGAASTSGGAASSGSSNGTGGSSSGIGTSGSTGASSGGTTGQPGGSSSGTTGQPGGSSSGGASTAGGTGGSSSGNSGGAITCSTPATYQQNGGACGTERWPVKTATDTDVGQVDLVPQITTIAQLVAIARNQGGQCTRNPPTETQVFELQDVNLKFHDLESDSDYHIIATDNSGNSMIVEIPYPPCVSSNNGCSGSSTPLLCEITHARSSMDSFKPANDTAMGVGTVIGIGFFDYAHGQTGVAPNVIELHPVLAICLGQGCDPLAGY
ncbi:MAG: hypothetical protein ACYDCL_23675 [Myxococcales bacterium]